MLAFTIDVLIFYFTITPLCGIEGKQIGWAEEHLGNKAWGILIHYGLRAFAAGLIGAYMVHSKIVRAEDFGLSFKDFGSDLKWVAKVIGVLVALSAVLMAIGVVLLRVFNPSLKSWPLEMKDQGALPYVMNAIIAAPLVEEFVCRSLMVPGLLTSYSRKGTIVMGAVLFYALHLAYAQPFWYAHYLFAGGVLTWAFLERKKLWVCVLLHAGGNFLVITDDLLLRHAPDLFKKIVGKLPG